MIKVLLVGMLIQLNAQNVDFSGNADVINLEEIKNVEVSLPSVSNATTINDKKIKEINNSIIRSIKYCEKNKISSSITDGLKRLLLYGTDEEKLSFLNSEDKFTIPQRLSFLKIPEIDNFLNVSKGQIQICEKKTVE
mgnify:CR=1 FL=1